ncbi:MAG: hypothetical protein K2X87_23205, partial [Gemmataceae bacterium]|nr:hypothetical protein [Gemmataceae bacterium]
EPVAVVPKDEPLPPGPAPAAVSPAADGVARPRTAEEFAQALADGAARVELPAGATIDLTKLDRPATFQGDAFHLTAAAGTPMPRVRVTAYPADQPGPGALAVQAPVATVAGVWFEVVPPPAADQPADGGPVGLVVSDARQVEFRDCVFLPAEGGRFADPLTAVAIGRAEAGVTVRAERCLFGPVAVGLRVPGRSTVEVTDGGFVPTSAGVLVRGDGAAGADPATVRLDRSSFALDPGSAAVAAEGLPAPPVRVTAGNCVFAPAAATDGGFPANLFAARPGAVVRVPDRPAGFQLDAAAARPNVFYRVDPVAAGLRTYPWAEGAAPGLPVSAGGWVGLRQRPWDADGPILTSLAGPDPWRAFRLRLTDPDLFVPDKAVWVAGARFAPEPGTGGPVYPGPWPPTKPAAVVAGVKVWWPKPPAGTSLRAGEYDDLVKLLRDARSGDTVLIRADGPVPVEPVIVEPPKPAGGADRADFHLTFKPDPRSRPVLVPSPSRDLNLSLFRIREGRVAFEGLEFRLAPGPDQEAVAAVTVVAGRGCSFTRCVFTLEEGDDGSAAAVALAEAGREMKMDGPGGRAVPRVSFDGCLIRGKGRGVWVPASRPFHLDLEQCVTALDGPVVGVKAAGRDPGGAVPAAVRLSRVTALLGGPVVELHAGRVGEMRATGLVPVEVTADGCLFAAVPGAGRPVAEVVGADLDKADPNRVLRWDRGDAPNRYANFDSAAAAAVVRPGDGPDREWGWTDWIAFAREVGRPVGRVVFADGPDGPKDLASVAPADLRVRSADFPGLMTGAKPGDAGADPEKVARPLE